MTWLTWRQFRMAALSVSAGLVAIFVLLGITGPGLVGRTNFTDQDFLFSATIAVLLVLPAVIGVFWGVPLITREVETGTHSLVWNQSITRNRWLTNKLVIGLLASMLAAGLLALAVTWWASPIDAAAGLSTDRSGLNRMQPMVFAARGIVPIGYAAFAFVLGVSVGMVLRRTVVAMAVTLVLFVGVQVGVPFLVRPHALPATTETVAITSESIMGISGDGTGLVQAITVREPAGAWVLGNETVDSSGNVTSPLPDFVRTCLPRPGQSQPAPNRESVGECMAQLGAHGYRQRLTYQPASRFWPLQWVELGYFLVASALLTWFCFRRIRHVS
ncbi:ABC transporter permease subunit [Amycolatopsis acidicola]|uniref:ABC transporter permease subunit n=1 Tax=Amycolatopsis acidicola TaxID=2596893 RepID=A0A5N0V4G8_9PSEU|nr:ABC transporter permease subunit [Amycolatopsis acidicola]KAA9159973.1 ABC transporter permease subunit [Amycolatopsis acidicola]